MPNKDKVKPLSNNVLLKWIIENFFACPEEHENSLDCPQFELRDAEVQINLYPRGVSKDYREFISLFIEMDFVGDNEIEGLLEMTDAKDNTLVCKKFKIKPCEEKVEFGFLDLVPTETVLNKITRSKCDSLIVKCYLKKIQSKTYPITELVARTLIGVNQCSFTWFIENLESNSSQRKVIYFPQLTKMKFILIINQALVKIAVLKWNDEDNIFRRDDDERDRDGDYGLLDGEEGSLVFKVSFSSVEREKLMTHQAWMDFDYHDEDSEEYCYTFKKERLAQSFNESASLQCEVTISCATYLKHVIPVSLKNRRKSLK